MSHTKNGGPRVKTALTVFAIIEALEEMGGAGITELANELGLAKSTVHSHLVTLHEAEYVVREEDRYHLSLKFLKLGEHARMRKREFRDTQQKVEELAETTQERAQFIVEEHGRGVYVHRAVGENAVHTDPGVGHSIPLHMTAAGKAILAAFPDSRVEEILARHGLEAVTEHTITDEGELFDELEEIRERGYAMNLEENIAGLHAVGVAVRRNDGSVCGAFSVSGPSHRITGERLREELPNLLLGTANELELNLQYS